MIESRTMLNHSLVMDPSAHQNSVGGQQKHPKKDYKDRRRSSIFSFLKRNKKLMRQNSAPVDSLQNDVDAARLASHLEYFRKMALADSNLSIADGEPVVYRNGYTRTYAVNGELEGVGLTDSESEVSGGAMCDTGAAPHGSELTQRRLSDALRQLRQMYVEDAEDDVGPSGELVEEMAEENKSLLWFLVKQVRPGMDLSKVVLPTFILESRSFLDKLSDNYYHADILASASRQDDAYQRFKTVLRWYLSGLYRKPRGLKKPYNPVLGELFRCFWWHPDTDTRTYYIAEQVSHHPPVSAFYVSNRKDGFVIEGSLLAKSKFYGNSTSALLEGSARIVLVNRARETYYTTAPFAHCKGLVVGTLSMELGGKVQVSCPTTGYNAEIDFKLKPFLGGADQTNSISGRIKRGKETVASVEGYWDAKIDIRDKRTGEESVLLDCGVLREQRLRRHVVRPERQLQFESQRLWSGVSRAIAQEDQIAATEEKTAVEEAQRQRARNTPVWQPTHFHKDHGPLQIDGLVDQGWRYNYTNTEPWSEEELVEYEEEFVVKAIRSSEPVGVPSLSQLAPLARQPPSDSDSLHEHDDTARRSKHYSRNLKKTLSAIEATLREQSHAVERLRSAVEALSAERRSRHYSPASSARSHSWDVFAGFVLAIVLQAVLNWMYFRKD